MTAYYVTKILDEGGIYRPNTFVLGDVELRSPKSDFSDELKVIKESIKNNKSQLKPEFNCRISTIVHAENLIDAELLADEKFVSTLDLISAELPLSKLQLSECGYVKNLTNGELSPIKDLNFSPGTVYTIQQHKFPKMEFNQWLINEKSDLSLRYRRSLHWSRNGKWEKNLQIRIIFNWFAVEALLKESEHDNVGPLIRWFLGYPNGTQAQFVSNKTMDQLNSNPLYEIWKRKIIKSIEQIREFRNDSVHSGFRNVDFSVSEIKLFNQIMIFGCSRCQGAVYAALINKIETVSEFKEYISIIFENNNNLVNDVHGNILYSLANNSYNPRNSTIYK